MTVQSSNCSDERSEASPAPHSPFPLGTSPKMMFAELARANFHVHGVQGELPATEAGKLCEDDIRSLFPGEPLIDGAVYVEKFRLLPAVLEAGPGDNKAEPLKAALQDRYDPKKYPAQTGTYDTEGAVWFLDKAAARLIG